jgi:hypothetical protein
MINITRVDIQNGKNYPALRTFDCNVTVDKKGFELYRKRLRKVFEKRYKVDLTILFTYRTL